MCVEHGPDRFHRRDKSAGNVTVRIFEAGGPGLGLVQAGGEMGTIFPKSLQVFLQGIERPVRIDPALNGNLKPAQCLFKALQGGFDCSTSL